MATHEMHRQLTRSALALLPEAFTSSELLWRRYCLFPDLAVTGSDTEALRFCFTVGGLPFHNPPDAPYDGLYRYYAAGEEGQAVRVGAFVNPHYEFSVQGLRLSLDRILAALRESRPEDALRHLGVLLHFLQDGTFGVHCLEGPGGVDVNFFDRLGLWEDSPRKKLASLAVKKLPEFHHDPVVLGETPDEAVLRLYRRYAAANAEGRRRCVKILLNPADESAGAEMFADCVRLCADALFTVQYLSRGLPAVSGRRLAPSELPFYEPPWDGRVVFEADGLRLDCAAEQHLFYRTPEGLAASLEAEIRLAEASADSRVRGEFLNRGAVAQRLELTAERPSCRVTAEAPALLWGFRWFSPLRKERLALSRIVLRLR